MSFEGRRDSKNAYERKRREGLQEIGSPPEVVNVQRKESCRHDLKAYLETYRRETFDKPWSVGHLEAIRQLQRVILDGGQHILIMPRGEGKTSLTCGAAEWAILYGHRRWICLVGATLPKATKLLKNIKTSLRFNNSLIEDFPGACYPIRQLEGRATRAIGQKCGGKETMITWEAEELGFPVIEGCDSSGSCITCVGITGDIRGQQKMLPDGTILRPDLVIPDDPQTRESAGSMKQVQDRIDTIMGDIMGLAGPGVKISLVMPGTIVYANDLIDRMQDKKEFPDFTVTRTQMLYGEPDEESFKHWDEYRDIRYVELKNETGTGQSNEYYAQNREVMDRGLRAGWEERFSSDELSAIQHAMNLRFRDETAFMAEYQNLPKDVTQDDTISAKQIINRVGHTEEYVVPEDSDKLVAFIDVQKEALFWVICSFRQDYTGTVVSYGAWPDQGTKHFTYGNLRRKLSDVYHGAALEDMLSEALDGCCSFLLDQTYRDEFGGDRSIQRVLVDANWGQSTKAIYHWATKCKWRSLVLPSHGKYVGASTNPLNDAIAPKPGIVIGTHWRIARNTVGQRYVLFDSNYWKSFVMSRLATEPGRRGSLVLFAARPHVHETFAAHVKAEYPVRTQGRGREVDEWKAIPGNPDNHWLDCLVGCHVAAGIEGCSLGDKAVPQPKPKSPPGKNKGRVSYL